MCKYEVKCKCGHVGRGKYIIIAFPIIAENGKRAASKARHIPRVKHDQKDAIISVREINDEEYQMLRKLNNEDGYLRCKCNQDQKLIDLSGRVHNELEECQHKPQKEHKRMYIGKTMVRRPKKFFKNAIDVMEIDYNEETYIC